MPLRHLKELRYLDLADVAFTRRALHGLFETQSIDEPRTPWPKLEHLRLNNHWTTVRVVSELPDDYNWQPFEMEAVLFLADAPLREIHWRGPRSHSGHNLRGGWGPYTPPSDMLLRRLFPTLTVVNIQLPADGKW